MATEEAVYEWNMLNGHLFRMDKISGRTWRYDGAYSWILISEPA